MGRAEVDPQEVLRVRPPWLQVPAEEQSEPELSEVLSSRSSANNLRSSKDCDAQLEQDRDRNRDHPESKRALQNSASFQQQKKKDWSCSFWK